MRRNYFCLVQPLASLAINTALIERVTHDIWKIYFIIVLLYVYCIAIFIDVCIVILYVYYLDSSLAPDWIVYYVLF